jgi:hypothetical protein
MDPNTSPVGDDQPQTPEWSSASLPADPQPLEPVLLAPVGAAAIGEDPALAWPMPPGGFAVTAPPPRPTSRLRRGLILGAAIGGTAVVILGTIGLHQIFGRAGTTKSFELVSPPPATVAGFVQDVTAESQPGFKSGVANFRRLYASRLHLAPSDGIIALYQGNFAGPNAPATVVVYVGFKVPETDDTSNSVSAALRGFGSRLTNVTTLPVSGGVGDTSFECVTADGGAVTGVPGQLSTCGWATDRTLGFLIHDGPDPGAKTLSALMHKMWPALVHH